MRRPFITFEGTEATGKSTQIQRLASRLRDLGLTVRVLREPGGTPLGEEIRHLLKHSPSGHQMSPMAELLLLNASRAQLVQQVIQPALKAGEAVLCDRFLDSTVAYQGYGRQLDLGLVRQIIAAAVGTTHPDLTLLLHTPLATSEQRRLNRQLQAPNPPPDRFEQSDPAFFTRVELGFQQIAAAEPQRVRLIDASPDPDAVADSIWNIVRQRFDVS